MFGSNVRESLRGHVSFSSPRRPPPEADRGKGALHLAFQEMTAAAICRRLLYLDFQMKFILLTLVHFADDSLILGPSL